MLARGLEPGERVVTEGQNQLRPGARVSVRQPGGDPSRGGAGGAPQAAGGKRPGKHPESQRPR